MKHERHKLPPEQRGFNRDMEKQEYRYAARRGLLTVGQFHEIIDNYMLYFYAQTHAARDWETIGATVFTIGSIRHGGCIDMMRNTELSSGE